jgi:hypothetical protein
MTGMAFDTLKTAKTLADAGFPAAQAEALSAAMATAVTGHVATKEDVAKLDGKIDAAMAKIEGRLNLHQWMLGVVVALCVGILLRVLTM